VPELPAECDVAIVGLGPVGATLANLLGQAGWRVCVLEREPEIFALPRAVHYDGETMRIFQAAGLRAPLEAVSRPSLKGMPLVNAAGQVMLMRKPGVNPGPHGCSSNYHFHQPSLETVLRQGLERFADVTVRLRHEVVAIDDAPARRAVRLGVRDLASDTPHTLAARYVVGCDGARSIVRRSIGSTRTDLGLHQPWLVLDVLLKRDVALPDHTVQYCDPARPMTYVNLPGGRRRWEIMLMPGDDPATIARPEHVWPMLARFLQPEDAEVERMAVYTFHSVVAEGWRRGRLLLAGDAAHQTPPFLGQGMCAGIRDASNLAWKLDWVLRGLAHEALLDTYERERKPHVSAFIALAVRLGAVIQATDPAVAAERDARFASGDPEMFTYPPPQLGPGLHDEASPAGSIFPQPALDDGRLLDEALGSRCAVLGDAHTLAGAADATRAAWRRIDARVLDAPGRGVQEWLATNGARAVMLRPDRYVLGIARTGADLDRLTAVLPLSD
jgi:3-(3-hydroxy-phenyl)propionate hydroxylase